MDRDQLLAAFQFATTRGFVPAAALVTEREDLRLSLDGPGLRIEVSHNARDGVDCSLVFPGSHGPSISIGTLIGALGSDDVGPARSDHDVLEEQARFACRHLERFLTAPSEVLDDCRALRFYDAVPWRQEWGRAIPMSAHEVDTARRRLERLRDYFVDGGQ